MEGAQSLEEAPTSGSETAEVKSPTSISKTESPSISKMEFSPPRASGAIPKIRSRTGGVKLGSFRIGGKKKSTANGADSNQDTKEEKKRLKKVNKKGKNENDKPVMGEVEGDSSNSLPKQSMQSKATSLVRRLSIGKYKTSASVKYPKSPTQESTTAKNGNPNENSAKSRKQSEEGSQAVPKMDTSTEDDRFSTASSTRSTPSVVTSGRPSLEGVDSTPTSTAEGAVDQSASACPTDSKAQQVTEKREHLYKILVIGELGTGKTSIIKRYVHQFFSQHYRATIGVDFALKVLNWDSNTIIRLQLWDIAGQERFGNMTRVYYKEAVGAFIVFDVTRVGTFDAVVKWKQDLDTKVQLPDGSPIPCVLLANKCDQPKEGLVNTPSKMEEYCKEKGFSAWFETSAKENINIEEAARCLVNKILQNDRLIRNNESSKDLETFALDGRNHKEHKTKTCSC